MTHSRSLAPTADAFASPPTRFERPTRTAKRFVERSDVPETSIHDRGDGERCRDDRAEHGHDAGRDPDRRPAVGRRRPRVFWSTRRAKALIVSASMVTPAPTIPCCCSPAARATRFRGTALETFRRNINELSIELAKKLVADGEGATHVMAIRVHGAEDEQSAETIAKIVAASPLVKTAITGGDPNWGRIVSAAGNAEAKIDPERTSLQICGETIYETGSPQPFDAALSEKMKQSEEVSIELTVGNGAGEAEYWSSDLTTEYVRFNSEYTT